MLREASFISVYPFRYKFSNISDVVALSLLFSHAEIFPFPSRYWSDRSCPRCRERLLCYYFSTCWIDHPKRETMGIKCSRTSTETKTVGCISTLSSQSSLLLDVITLFESISADPIATLRFLFCNSLPPKNMLNYPNKAKPNLLDSSYNQFCYNTCWENMNLFQYDWYIKKPFKYTSNVIFASAWLYLGETLGECRKPHSVKPS